jgi:hypothetical protein
MTLFEPIVLLKEHEEVIQSVIEFENLYTIIGINCILKKLKNPKIRKIT